MELVSKKCVPCEAGVPPLTPPEAKEYLRQVPGWTLDEDAKKIFREFVFKDFKEAMRFVNLVAKLAESERHHPDISIWFNRVKLELSTHAIKGLSENDFILAAKINLIKI